MGRALSGDIPRLKSRRRWGRPAPWRWYMRRARQPGKPVTRRIPEWLGWVKVLGFAAFLTVFFTFVVERNG